MRIFFQDNSSDELIVLLNGWGMDEKPFQPIKSSRDILFVSDYSDLNFELPTGFDFSKYTKKILISFSAGVFMGAYLQDKLPEFDLKIAVDGTFYLMDDKLGIPSSIMNEMENLTLKNALEFRKKLVDKKEHYNLFNRYQPSRSLESSLEELEALKHYSKEKKFIYDYDRIFIGNNDNIIPAENQLKAWKGHDNILRINAGHFQFYYFENFDEIIAQI